NDDGIAAETTPVCVGPILMAGVAGNAAVPKNSSERSRVEKPGTRRWTKLTSVPNTVRSPENSARFASKFAERIGLEIGPKLKGVATAGSTRKNNEATDSGTIRKFACLLMAHLSLFETGGEAYQQRQRERSVRVFSNA